jgi:hypothetical protein
MSDNDDFNRFSSEVAAAAEEGYATLHREVALYLETWTIARTRVKPSAPVVRP